MNKKILVGSTGLVGSTLKETIRFDYEFNSKNIDEFFNVPNNCDLYLSCLPATKWIVNQNLTDDLKNIYEIIETLKLKTYRSIYLISTIDVYNDSPIGSNEDYAPNISKSNYGNNRYFFELFVSEVLKYEDLKIFRLPAIFNKHIKKNILYDLINNNNVGKINTNTYYQWYNLDNLSSDIDIFSTEYSNETKFNLFSEPIHTLDIVSLFPKHLEKVYHSDVSVNYNYTTKFGGYYTTKESIFHNIKTFIDGFSIK